MEECVARSPPQKHPLDGKWYRLAIPIVYDVVSIHSTDTNRIPAELALFAHPVCTRL